MVFLNQIYPKDMAVNEDMYNQMYDYAGRMAPGGYHDRHEFGMKSTAIMVDSAFSKVTLI